MKYNQETGLVEVALDWRAMLRYGLAMLVAYFFGSGSLPFPQLPPQQPFIPPPIVQPPPPPPVVPPVVPPITPIPQPPERKADPVGAIVKINYGGSGCTGIHLGDLVKSGHSYWLTAAHCTGGLGSTITVTCQTGDRLNAQVVKRDTSADISIARSPARADYPFARLAEELPEPGTPVWHKGKGLHKPDSLEKGVVTGYTSGRQQVAFRLSVSSGDSGSAICREDTGEIVAVVCCSGGGRMYGGSCVRARELIDSIEPPRNYERGPEPCEKVRKSCLRSGPLRGLIRAMFRRH